jgi:hypothetical protein
VHAAAEAHDTSVRESPGLGLGTTVQVVPFQDSMRVLSAPGVLK